MVENLYNLQLWGKALGFVALGFVSLLAYFLPAIVASLRHHRNSTGIFLLNLLLGWTLLGWVGSLIWAVYREKA